MVKERGYYALFASKGCIAIHFYSKETNFFRQAEKRTGANNYMKALKTVWNVITTVLVTLVVVLAILLVGVRVVGLTPYVVLSGSMEPTYHTGSLIYVKKVDPFAIEAGDPITFMLSEDTIATHRVVGVVPDENDSTVIRFRTKGDANEAEDGTLIHYKNVIGSPVFSIPYLGFVSNYITNPPGMYIGFTVLGLIILMLFAPDLLKAADAADKKAEEKKKGSHEAE